MEQDKHEVLDLSEGKEHGGGIAPAVGPSGEVAEAQGLTEPEGVSAVDNSGHSTSLEGSKNEDLEEPLPWSEGVAAVANGVHGAASSAVDNAGHSASLEGSKNEDLEEPLPWSEGVAAVANGVHGAASSAVDNAGHSASLEGSKNEDLEEPLPWSEGVAAVANGVHGAASGSTKNEDYEVFNNPAAIRFEFRATAANTTPPSTYRRLQSQSRKISSPTHFFAAGGSKSTSSSWSVSGSPEDSSAMVGADQDAASGSDKNKDDQVVTNERKACLLSGATAANATPPSTYRLLPSRSRKQSGPMPFIAAGCPASAGTHAASNPPPPVSHGSSLPSASPSGLDNAIRPVLDAAAAKASSDAKDEAASSSYRLPSRGRKQPRPDHFIPEQAEARARAKAHRSNIVLDRFLSSLVRGSSEPRLEWVRNVTADGVRGQRRRQSSMEGFKIRDVSHHASCHRGLRAAISRFEATSYPSSSARPGYALPSATASGGPEEPDESGTIFSVLAILGASLALSVVSCVLFYIVGQRTESGPSGEQQKK